MMKLPTLATLIALALAGLALPSSAQDSPETPEILPWQRDFENLEPATRQKVTEMLIDANRLYRQKRIFEALNLLHELEQIHGDIPDLHNLKGASYVEFRDFARAREAFDRANQLSPNNSDVLFNLAELAFVTHQWASAERQFENVRSMIPERNIPMARLVDFKLFLVKMKLEKEDEVQQYAEKYDHSDDSPFYYYAQAALAYRDGDTNTAESWLRTAQRVFRKPEHLTPWMDTMVEFGYIKSFYGGDLQQEPTVPEE